MVKNIYRWELDYENAYSKDIMLIGESDDIAVNIIYDLGWDNEFYEYYEQLKKWIFNLFIYYCFFNII